MPVSQALSKELNTTCTPRRGAPGGAHIPKPLLSPCFLIASQRQMLPSGITHYRPRTVKQLSTAPSVLAPWRVQRQEEKLPAWFPSNCSQHRDREVSSDPLHAWPCILSSRQRRGGGSHSPVKNTHHESKSSCQTVHSFIPSSPA